LSGGVKRNNGLSNLGTGLQSLVRKEKREAVGARCLLAPVCAGLFYVRPALAFVITV
jgi:hypothetical protein